MMTMQTPHGTQLYNALQSSASFWLWSNYAQICNTVHTT